MAVPNIFGTATSAIPLSQLDTNFATPVTIGNTAVQLGNTVTSFGNVTLTNVTISSGNVTITGANVSGTANVSTLVVTGNQTSLGNVTVTGNISANIVTVSAGSNTAPSITTTGDTNTGIFFPAADTIAFSEGGVEAMRIDSSGNVGINTTSPSTYGKFAVVGASANRAFYTDANAQPVARYDDNSFISAGFTLRNTGVSGSNQGIGVLFQLGTGGTAVDSGAIQMRSEADYSSSANQDAAMTFSTVLNGTNTERMRIDSSGNVGIGTASPSTKLHVSGGTSSVSGTNGIFGIANGNTSGGMKLYAYTAAGTANGYLAFEGYSAEYGRFDASGNLLVGTSTSVGSKLYVIASSSSAIRGDASTAATVAIYGVHSSNSSTGYVAYLINTGASNGQYLTNTGSWQAISDARLKTDVKNLDSTSRLLQLRPVDYLWKSQETSEEPSKRSFGFIAQEVKEVFPELVTVSPDGMFGVEYTGLISPLVKAIQEQQALIQSLTTRITALEAK